MPKTSPIDLPYTPESAVAVLRWGTTPDASPYTHRQIAEWCDRFWCQYLDADAPPEIESLLPILSDVDAQWDLYLCNTYLEQLPSLDQDQVRLPNEWFLDWFRQASGA